MADILISEQYSPCQATLQPCSPVTAPNPLALLHLPTHQRLLIGRVSGLGFFTTGVCAGEKKCQIHIFTAYLRHKIIHNVIAIRWNCCINMSEAHIQLFLNLRAIVAESEKKSSKLLKKFLFLQHFTAYTDTNFRYLKINIFQIVSLDQLH